MLMNKTAIECWNILKYEIESIIDKFVPFRKQGKRCRKKHLSKEAIRKIMLKQTMWRVVKLMKYEIESIIDKFVPFRKQGKRCRKKHLSKEAIRKIMLKQTMWRVVKRVSVDTCVNYYFDILIALLILLSIMDSNKMLLLY